MNDTMSSPRVDRRRAHGFSAALGVLLSLAPLATTSCGSTQDVEITSNATQADQAAPTRVYRVRDPGTPSAPRAASAPAGAHLNYFGGRVVSNMQVVQVLYGAASAGNYIPQVANTTSPSMATFYQGVLNSPYVDWLTEYNTTSPLPLPRTNQIIGRGSFLSQVTITPAAANDGAVIDDTQIQAEISAQIQAGILPAPTHDTQGNNNTYYAVFFPSGKTITLQGSASCEVFCAYHGTIANGGGQGEVYYGVHPDLRAPGCNTGCGLAPTVFGNFTQVASHEMIETVTDAEVGLASTFGPPLAWADFIFSEIGDICNDQHATIVGGDGVTYDVQTEFSNALNDCIVSKSGTPANLPPTVNAGPDQTITLPAAAALMGTATDDGLPNPPGTLTLSWSEVSGPGTVTFTSPSAAATSATFSAAGTYVLRLTANDGALATSDDVTVTVNPPSPTNQPPTVSAGPDQTITLPSAATLAGTATDDGLPNPPGKLTVAWTAVSGPGTVTFANAGAAATTATFSTSGTYVLRLTANDGALSASDDAQIVVNAVTNAGPCADLCANPVNFTINGSLQSGAIGTGAVCLQTTSVVHGGNCGNFVAPRTLKVNGTVEPCDAGNWASIPPPRNGGYCIQTTAGNQPWGFITAW